MTIDEFLAELKLCVPRSAWHQVASHLLRAQWQPPIDLYCPITALAWWRDSEQFFVSFPCAAGDYLGLSRDDVYAITAAADGIVGHDAALRAKLLAVTINK